MNRQWKGAADIVADVTVVGGGMVGMALAAALGGVGVRVAVIEPAPAAFRTDAAADGRASAIAAGSAAVLAGAGAWDALAPHAQPILEIRVSDGRSPFFLHYDHAELGAGPLGWMAENTRIRAALIARLGALPAVTLVEGAAVTALETTGAGATVTAGTTRVRSALVVAADGRRSRLREMAGIRTTRWTYPQTGIVCTVAHARDHRGVAQERFLPAGPFAILPLKGRRSSIVWTEEAALARHFMGAGAATFAEELALRFGDFLGALRLEGPRFSYPLGLLHAERYTAPRLALAGDAAHAMHPIAGQGLNMGLRDVAALAEVVADALRLGLDPGSVAVLERYERWRRFDNTLMLAATDSLNRLFSNDLAPVKLARDLGLAAVHRVAPLKRLFMRHAMGLMGELPRLMRGEAL